jgi:nucleotide-binding universal stress UspA family protein
MPTPLPLVGNEGISYSAEVEAAETERYRAVLDAGVERLRGSGLEVQGELAVGSSVDEIVKVARRVQADLIVVGHKHLDSWAQRWWRGSVSKSLIEVSPCSVLVVIIN